MNQMFYDHCQSACSYLTICSIFFFHLGSIFWRYSGRISMAAKLKEDPFNPDQWHSITVEVKMGTMSTEKMVPSISIVHYTMGKIERLSTQNRAQRFQLHGHDSCHEWQFYSCVEAHQMVELWVLSASHLPQLLNLTAFHVKHVNWGKL